MGCRSSKRDEFYAHSLEGRPPSEWHLLEDHLRDTAEKAAEFAAAFGSAEWGRLAGLWHDLGKCREEFQERLEGSPERVDHAAVGAAMGVSKDAHLAIPLAFSIAGHHGGLPNLNLWEAGSPRPLRERITEGLAILDRVLHAVPSDTAEQPIPSLPGFLQEMDLPDKRLGCRRTAFWIRFLFSALVDADFLDTEAFFRPGIREAATTGYTDIATLQERLDHHIAVRFNGVESTDVNVARREVLEACRRKAEKPPGVFTLTVPTGGGKTLSGMAFALNHAERYGMRRVIYVAPFTSIIEQNAKAYRKALGADNVIEHHSNLDPEQETDRNRLASENWDAPIIVTTAVQFFESLFANKPSRCRKLHNVARSVIILDEAQKVPIRYLSVILEALKELAAHYGCTVVLATATQPALGQRESLPEGFETAEEIAPDASCFAERLRRVSIHWPDPDGPAVEWPDLADRVAREKQVLVVVHRRQDARDLARLLPEEGRFHLSALMCGAHRSDVLDRVRETLKAEAPCRLVSTQVVEAGVDIDFPVVYRALGGLDSVVQAAGRCNREGELDEGRVIVFRAPTRPPHGTLSKGLGVTESMLRQTGGTLDAADPGVFTDYFRRLYLGEDLDAKGLRADLAGFNFATAARKFRLIEDGFTHPVVVPYGEAMERVESLRKALESQDGLAARRALRALQPYTVNVYDRDYGRLHDAGALETMAETVEIIAEPFRSRLYDPVFGLLLEDPLTPDPDSMIA